VFETMRTQTHFQVLGVATDATAGDVDAAYEELAREYHPDQFRSRPDDVRSLGLRIFDRLGEAQVVLRDTTRRRKYQAQLERERAEVEDGDSAPFIQRESSGDAAEQVYFAGVEHLRARRYREAVQAFRQAASLSPGQASYRGALGWALFRQAPADIDAIQAGLTELRRAVQMEPTNPWVRISLGRFFAETGYPDDAISEFEVALRLNPGLGDIEEEIRRLRGQT
jgi:curved DNA-binding protein CbpA